CTGAGVRRVWIGPSHTDLFGRRSHRHAQGVRGAVRSGPGSIVLRAPERAPVFVLQRPAQSVEGPRLTQSPLPSQTRTCNAQRNRLKVLVWDGSGLWVCAKRLEKGRFTWPQSGDAQGKVVLSYEELSLLLGGIDLAKTKHKRWYRKALPEGHAAA